MPPLFSKIKILSAIATLVLSGCGSGDPNFSILPDQDVFVNELELNNKLDILFVIDNSGSMSENQNNMANNFNAFITDFAALGYDYKIAVTVTDAWRHLYVSSSTSKRNLVKFKDGISTDTNPANHTGLFVLTPDTVYPAGYPDLISAFNRHIRQGTNGSGDERGLQSFVEALKNNHNAGFIRTDAHLAIIIISDEEDFSWNGSTNKQEANNGAGDYTNLYTIQHYLDELVALKGTAPDIFSVSAIGIKPGDVACKDANGADGKYMQRVKDMVDATDGVMGSICDPSFANTLDEIQDNIGTLSTQFFLSRLPNVASIVVRINGVMIPNNATNGWTYDSTNNSVKFHGTAKPAQGATISIDFDPIEL